MKQIFHKNSRSIIRINPWYKYLLIGFSLLFIINLSSLKAQCPDGITNYWTFNTDNSGITRDTIGSCHGSTGMNSSTAPAGQVGKASNFNGSRYVNFPDYPSYAWNGSLSVSLWCKFADLTDSPMVMLGYDRTGSTHWWIGAEATTGRPSFYLYDNTRAGNGVVGSTTINNNVWHFMAATYNASDNSLRLYVDGVLVADSTQAYSNPFTVDGDLGMGAMYKDLAWNFFYTGLLDEVALYNRALTSTEITQLFTKGASKGNYCLQLNSKPEFISDPDGGVQLGETYIYDVEAIGLPDPSYSLSVAPPGMTINDITGVINWKPAETGTYNVLVEALNTAGNTRQAFTIKVVDPCIDKMLTYFTFEEDSGQVTYDDAYYIEGTLKNSPTWSKGIVDGGLAFNGIDQYLTFPDYKDDYDWPVGKSFTFELWCRSQESQNELQVILSRGTTDGAEWWLSTQSSTGNAVFFLYDAGRNGGGIVGKTSINDGEWHHIVGLRDAAIGYNKLYVDGRLEADSIFTYSSSFASASDIQLANYFEGSLHKYFFDGTLDEIAVYDKALTEAEVKEHYSKGINGFGYCSSFTIAPKIVSESVRRCYVNQGYIYQVEATGVPAPTFNLSGAPSGLSINTFSGKISGIPTIPGEYPLSISATNDYGTDVQNFTLEVLESCIGNTSFYFDFEDVIGDTIYDVFSPREGYLVNSPVRKDGLVGKAIDFNGNDQRAYLPKEEEYDWSGDESFTIELWCLPGAVPELLQVIIGRDVPESTHWWMGTSSNTGTGVKGVPVFYLFDADREGSGVVGNSTIHDGEWHHLAAVREGNTGHTFLYVDGILQADSIQTYKNDFAADVNIQVANLYIDYQNKYFFEGKLDEIAIYKRALSADEIRGHYMHGLTGQNYCDAARLGPFIILEPFH